MTWFDQYIYSWRDSLVGSTALGSIDITAAARIKAALAVCGSPTTSYDERMASRFDADIAPLVLPNLAKHYAAFTIASRFAASCVSRLPDRYELEALSAHLNRTKFTYVDLQPGACDLGAGIEIKAFVLKTRHVMNARKPTISPLPAGTILEAVIGHHGAFSTARLGWSMISFLNRLGSRTTFHMTGSVEGTSPIMLLARTPVNFDELMRRFLAIAACTAAIFNKDTEGRRFLPKIPAGDPARFLNHADPARTLFDIAVIDV